MPIPFLAAGMLPRLIGPLLIVVAIAGAIGYHKVVVYRANQRTEVAQQDTLRKHNELLIEREARAQLETNMEVLRGTVRKQNDAITALHEVGRHYEVAAKARAVERLRTGEKERLVIKLDPNFGPAAMNLWFQLTFGKAP